MNLRDEVAALERIALDEAQRTGGILRAMMRGLARSKDHAP
jgi:hypothetical protein